MPRSEFTNAAASAADSLWRAAAEAKARADAEKQWPYDSDCRFVAREDHRCCDYAGAPIRPGGSCWYEANAQMHDQRRREQFIEGHA